MLLIPQTPTTYGLIQKYKMHGVTSASSTNLEDWRTINPINYTTVDRWCSKSAGEFATSWWQVTLDYLIFPTNYSFSNSEFVVPRAWTLQGKRKDDSWINLSVIDESPIGENASATFPIFITEDGPFQTFRFISSINSLHTENKYHFCIHKFDIFGLAFKPHYPITTKCMSFIDIHSFLIGLVAMYL